SCSGCSTSRLSVMQRLPQRCVEGAAQRGELLSQRRVLTAESQREPFILAFAAPEGAAPPDLQGCGIRIRTGLVQRLHISPAGLREKGQGPIVALLQPLHQDSQVSCRVVHRREAKLPIRSNYET